MILLLLFAMHEVYSIKSRKYWLQSNFITLEIVFIKIQSFITIMLFFDYKSLISDLPFTL